jgi:dephospho-CoA kinase
MKSHVAELDTPYCLLVIPLLIETGGERRVHRVLVVDVDEVDQRERTTARDRVPVSQVEAILATQATRDQRLTAADDVIDNRGDPVNLDAQVERLHSHYLELAASREWPSPFEHAANDANHGDNG